MIGAAAPPGGAGVEQTGAPAPLHHGKPHPGPTPGGKKDRQELAALAESSLKAAQLWDEVKDRLQIRP